MPTYSIFNSAGKYTRTICIREDMLPLNIQEGEQYREGDFQNHFLDAHGNVCQLAEDAPEQLEQAWRDVRLRRDLALASTDWRVLRATEAGTPLSTAWRDYRQALRDVTQQPNPHQINWPQPPTEA